ncbi:hypothetical protein MPUL_32650 [Mycolicibacterium pulveris]|uniref:Uncharacterized protein n=1 Tax=Mycolicibacterium pulveris TaxID=36813 RepID=A0A7I7ULC6_MYCPV|nr:hypothetical protein MPUL_32650 [Mycolicibacterium pulveris]
MTTTAHRPGDDKYAAMADSYEAEPPRAEEITSIEVYPHSGRANGADDA